MLGKNKAAVGDESGTTFMSRLIFLVGIALLGGFTLLHSKRWTDTTFDLPHAETPAQNSTWSQALIEPFRDKEYESVAPRAKIRFSESLFVYEVVKPIRPYIESSETRSEEKSISDESSLSLGSTDVASDGLSRWQQVQYKPGNVVVGIAMKYSSGSWLQLEPNVWLQISSLKTGRVFLKFIKTLALPNSFFEYGYGARNDCPLTIDVCDQEAKIRKEVRRLLDYASRSELELIEGTAQFESSQVSITMQDLINDGISNIEASPDVEERRELCRSFKTWMSCTRQGFCAWRKLPNKDFCFLDNKFNLPKGILKEEYDPALNDNGLDLYVPEHGSQFFSQSEDDLQKFYLNIFNAYQELSTREKRLDSNKDEEKFFVYQPSGGMNNQRVQLTNAVIICRLLGRTCVLPPAAPHTNFYENYNKQPGNKLTSQQRLLNSRELMKVANVSFIPQGETLVQYVNDKFELYGSEEFHIVNKDYRKYKKPHRWDEHTIVSKFKDVDEKFLFFSNHSMWFSLEWKGTKAGYRDRKTVLEHVMYNDVIKKVARTLADQLSFRPEGFVGYNAIHVRRGDKKSEKAFSFSLHTPEWYVKRLLPFQNATNVLYVATDEKNRSFFQEIEDAGFELVFWEGLDMQVLLPFLNRYPARMFMDILSIVEQLMCVYSSRFLGSGYSTLTIFVLRQRRHRSELVYDTQMGPLDGIPFYSEGDTLCNPLRANKHSVPC